MSIIGINTQDLKDHGWNNLIGTGHVLVGYFAANIIKDLAKKTLKAKNDYQYHLATGIGVAGGIAISALLPTPLVRFSEDKNLQLFALQALLAFAAAWLSKKNQCLSFTFLGFGGYFGNRTLLVLGAAGAIMGAAKPSGH